MVHLIGVNHAVQFDRSDDSKIVQEKRASFKTHVLDVIDKLGIEILAEEFSDEAKKRKGVSETTLEKFAKSKGIEYRGCDPARSDRKKNVIDDDEKREKFWLDQITDCKNRKMLFVCGDKHFHSFAAKLTAAGFDVQHPHRWRILRDEFIP